MQRRTFLASAAAGAVALAADRTRVGVIGTGGRGQLLAAEFKEVGADVASVCDVYKPHLEEGLKAASTGASAHTDYRRLLEDKTLDAVIVATPEHWHARITVDAAAAGKDIYVEKPLCRDPAEGFAMAGAVRRHKRICQVGTQRRSSPLFQDAKALMASGRLGDVRLVNAWWVNYQRGLNRSPLTGDLDWDAWLGNSPKRPKEPLRYFNWLHYWDYSGGLFVGQGAHVFDLIQWLMGSNPPIAATASGGAPHDGAEVPTTAVATLEYAEGYLATFAISYEAMRYHTHNDHMTMLHGTKARFDVAREGYTLWPEQGTVKIKPEIQRDEPGTFVPATRAHIRNFLECVRTRNEPSCPIEEGVKTTIALAVAVAALRSGRRARWNAAEQRVET